MGKKKFKRISVTERTEQEIKYTAKVLGKTISGFLEELFDMIIQQSANFRDGANLSYLVEYSDVRLRFSGSKIVTASHFKVPSDATDSEINRLIKKDAQEKFEVDK